MVEEVTLLSSFSNRRENMAKKVARCRRCRRPINEKNPGKEAARVCLDCEEKSQSEERDTWDEDRFFQRSHVTFRVSRVRSP
jgi:hypothetical protein